MAVQVTHTASDLLDRDLSDLHVAVLAVLMVDGICIAEHCCPQKNWDESRA
jgi:hypothetical protein